MGDCKGVDSFASPPTINGKGKDTRKANKSEPEEESEICQGHPVDRAGWWSFATFSWMSDLMYAAYKEPLKLQDIPWISSEHSCRLNTEELEKLWAQEVGQTEKKPSLGRVLWRFVRGSVIASLCSVVISVVMGFFTTAIFLKRVLEFVSDPELTLLDGISRVALLIAAEFLRVLFLTLMWACCYRTAIRLKASCMGLVYRKLLRLANERDLYSGKILNLISSDTHRIYEVLVSAQTAISGPVILVLGGVYIYVQLGLLPLVGVVVFPLSYPLQYYLAKASASFKGKALQFRDSRLLYLSESLQNLKFLKMFAWEKYLQDLISTIRSAEKKYFVKSQLMHSWNVVLGPMLPHVGAIVTFILFVNVGNELTPAQAFAIIALYVGRIRPTLNTFRVGIRSYLEGLIAIDRIQTLLLQPEIQKGNSRGKSGGDDVILQLEDVVVCRRTNLKEMKHQKKKKKKKGRKCPGEKKASVKDQNENVRPILREETISFKLENLNLTITRGSFIGICGHVGSGKSTFLDTIAGSLNTKEGSVRVHGTIAYAPQDPWIFKDTFRNNILFGEPFQSSLYNDVLNSCCLTSDMRKFPEGDLTEALDNGANLSGGQKQRISLARAVYHMPQTQIFLLDDPFSGLDVRVAQTIYEKVVLEKLIPNKTVLLATHHVNFLRECDQILVFSQGKIVERGSHKELLEGESPHYKSALLTLEQNVPDQNGASLESLDESDSGEDEPLTREFDVEGKGHRGGRSWTSYALYMKHSGGPLAVIAVFFVFALNITSVAFSTWWLKDWFHNSGEGQGNDTNTTDLAMSISRDDPDFEFNRDCYAGIIGIIFLTSLVRTVTFVMITLKAAQRIHKALLTQFFQSRLNSVRDYGTGHILNLFTRDIGEIDAGLPHSLQFLLQNLFMILSTLVMVSIIFPIFLAPLCVLFGIFLLFRRVYNAAVKDLKRFESEAATPIFTAVNETVSGMGTIRAFGREHQLTSTFERLIDMNSSIHYIFVSSMRWLSFRLDCISVSVLGITAVFVLIFRGIVSAASCGLALSYAAQLAGVFQFTVRMAADVESKFICVERIEQFLSGSETETTKKSPPGKNPGEIAWNSPPLIISGNEKSIISGNEKPIISGMGHLTFSGASLTYSVDTAPVLKDLTFDIRPGSKIGILGRTGSGKSSIGVALYRLTELQSGAIHLDGMDVSRIPLATLRNSLCVIPQDVAIFSKSIRFNLDPGNKFSDPEIWTVLDKCGLKGAVESLDADVALSHGQKQLLSIARALLRSSVLVFVDEATSNMDMETAAVLDRLIVEEFRSLTVLIVAHRMHSLKFCDYLLVMEDGHVKDFGPAEDVKRKPEFINYFQTEKCQGEDTSSFITQLSAHKSL